MSVRMRHTKGHTGNRRSHHSLKEPRLSKCQDCGELHMTHRVCENCGKYRSRQVIDVEAKIAKKEAKTKEKKREMEQAGIKKDTKKGTDRTEEAPKKIGEATKISTAKPLDPQTLSHDK